MLIFLNAVNQKWVLPIFKREYLCRYKSVLLVLYIHGYVLVCSNIFWKARLLRVTSKASFCLTKNVQQHVFFRKIVFVNKLAKLITSSLLTLFNPFFRLRIRFWKYFLKILPKFTLYLLIFQNLPKWDSRYIYMLQNHFQGSKLVSTSTKSLVITT